MLTQDVTNQTMKWMKAFTFSCLVINHSHPVILFPQPILGNSVVVIHPGSLNLYIGRASDALPVCIPHCIARRHKNPGEQKRHEDTWLLRKECLVRYVQSLVVCLLF